MNLSAYDWIETRVPGGHSSPMGALLDVAYNEEYGGQTTDQTALNILGLLAYQPSPGQFSVFGLSDERYQSAAATTNCPGQSRLRCRTARSTWGGSSPRSPPIPTEPRR